MDPKWLNQRNGVWHIKLRLPATLTHGKQIWFCKTLKTTDYEEAQYIVENYLKPLRKRLHTAEILYSLGKVIAELKDIDFDKILIESEESRGTKKLIRKQLRYEYLTKIKTTTKNVDGIRFMEWKPEVYKCPYCNKEHNRKNRPSTNDHIIPLTKGGNTELDNLVKSCKSKNNQKYNKTLQEYLRKPNKIEISLSIQKEQHAQFLKETSGHKISTFKKKLLAS